MSAAHVRRGAATRAKTKKTSKVAMPKKIAKRLPVDQARANKIAGLAFGVFVLAIGGAGLVAFDIPAKAERAAGSAISHAGFTVSGYQITGINHMDRRLVDAVVTEELHNAAVEGGWGKAPQALISVSDIRRRLLTYGWVKDARVSRRLPDTLVIDIVERKPAALWQNQGQLALIDEDGIVLDRVPVDKMPDLPLLIGPGANLHEQQLTAIMADAPTLKPQLASATWIGDRRWDLAFQSGEIVALPEGEADAREALVHFARKDKTDRLLGNGYVWFDLRNWPASHNMTVRLAHAVQPAPKLPQVG